MLLISPQKLFLFSRYLSFCLDFLVLQQNGLIRKIRLISIFHDITAWLVAIHLSPNISRSIGNHTLNFGQLIEYNMRNIFLEKSYIKCGRETSSRLFSGKLNLSISLDQQSKVLYSLFLLYPKYRNILKPSCRPLAFTSDQAFFKNKKRSGTSFPALFSA